MEFVEEVIKKYDRMMSEQASWNNIWQDIADYVLPHKSYIIASRPPGSRQTEKIFDSTAIHANMLLAASMSSAITPANAMWFSLNLRGKETQGIEQEWLEDCANKMYIAIRQSNFNTETHEAFLGLGAFGIAAVYCEEAEKETVGFNGLTFKSLPIGSYAIDEDAEGKCNTLYRRFTLSASAAYLKWGKELSEKTLQVYSRTPEKMVSFLHAVYPISNGDKPFESVYIDLAGKKLLSREGYYEFPFFVPRWSKPTGEKYGIGPGFAALPDIKTLNKAVEYSLKAWAKALDPPLLVKDDGVIGTVKTYASGINYVRDMKNVAYLQSVSKFDVHEIEKTNIQSSIRRIFFSDQLQLQESPQMTATEVYVRYELMQRLLGPTLGRIENELLNPAIERIFGLMFRAGAFLPPPPELRGGNIDIEYEGPLAKAQKSGEIMTIQKFLQAIVPIAQIDPQVIDNIDFDMMAKEIAKASGVPAVVLRDERVVRDIRQARSQQQAAEKQAAEAERAIGMMEKAGKVVPAIKEMMPRGVTPGGEGMRAPGLPAGG